MKLSHAITLSILAGLLGSCCCPRGGHWAMCSQHSHHWCASCGKAAPAPSLEQGQTRGRSGKPQAESEETATAKAGASLACQGKQTLNVPVYEQEGYYSCWAASAEMIMEFLGGGRARQCEQAGVAYNHPDCCNADGGLKHGLCDQQWYPEFRKWGFEFDLRYWDPDEHPSGNPLSWDELTTEICIRGRPFAFSWAKQSGVNHMMVLIGFDETQGERMITYLDPLPSAETDAAMVPYGLYKGEGDYPHRDDYFNIRPGRFQ